MIIANPFIHRGPIRNAAYFFFFFQETSRTFELLRQAQSVSIVGPRRIGKTSLLFYLANSAVLEQYGLAPEQHCFIYVNCESCAALHQTELYELLLQEMGEALAEADIRLERKPASPANGSYRSLEQAVRTVARRQIRLVFLLDEFEALSANPHLDAQFFSGLRGLATRHQVAYVTVSTKLLLELTYAQTSVLSSPFFNFFAQIRLRPFARDEAELCLSDLAAKGGVTFTPATIDFLLELAGPHPFYLQLAAYHAFAYLSFGNTTLEQENRKQVRRRFLAEVEPHWTFTWNSLSSEDQKHLALLPLTQQTNLEAVERLRNVGVVLRVDNEIVFLSPTFREFISKQSVPSVRQAPPIILDTEQRVALLYGSPLSLTPTEFELLACLVTHAGQVVSHREIETEVWPGEYVEDHDRLKTVLKTLRRALGEAAGCIQNVRGIGYRFLKT